MIAPLNENYRRMSWFFAICAPFVMLMFVPFVAHDGDGLLYAKIGEEAVQLGFSELFQLKWYGRCAIHPPGTLYYNYFLEHPPGLFVLPMILFQWFGVPASKVLYASDLIYQLTSWCCIYVLVRRFVSHKLALLSVVSIIIMPISFLYSVRATQETPLLMSAMLMLVGVAFQRERIITSNLLIIFASAFAVALKGAMAIPVIAVAVAASVILSWRERDLAQTAQLAALTLVAAMVGGAFAGGVIEVGHHYFTGNDFWNSYWKLQISDRALTWRQVPSLGLKKALNIPFYFLQVLWYSCPFIVTGFIALRRKKIDLGSVEIAKLVPLVAVFGVGTVMYIVGMSVFDRTSQRYIFPVYYFVGLMMFWFSYVAWPNRLVSIRRWRPETVVMLGVGIWSLSRVLAIITNPFV